jgi:uncharacterized membrane protein YccC
MTFSLADWVSRHRVEFRLSLRMSAAGLLTYAVGSVLGLSQIYWAVLTAVIVMQASIGGSLKASLDRFVGTIGGAAWGVVVAVSVPHQGPVATGAALGLTLVPLSVLVAFKPGYRVATATGAMVLLARFGEIGVVEAGLNRVFEIGLGSVIALAVALLVTPARAHGLLGGAGRDALARMSELAGTLLGDLATPVDTATAVGFHDRIRAAIERAAIAADEAARERRSLVTEAPDPMPLVRCLRRLSHDFVIVARARSVALAPAAAERLTGPAGEMAAALSQYLSGIGAALAAETLPPPTIAAAFDTFQQAIADLRRDGITRALSGEEVERVFGLSFALDQIRSNLDDLAGHTSDLVKPPRR